MSTVDTLPTMPTVDSLPELDCSEQISMEDWSVTLEERVKMSQDASPVQPWVPERFEMVRMLQEAP
eukprot:CAMPEP_0172704256 /NCGR_PEP_ID=MMETSP1074-20121228/40775_1 /TAXON_ID=2916 /ORGANISM="Ceratium fusus, Strain PA161109" /LENGTH=65 /DNA_ID=CAMNT_0013526375 /DNA_START=47 /DNA_END=240 /DNA_ORIENTATION=-